MSIYWKASNIKSCWQLFSTLVLYFSFAWAAYLSMEWQWGVAIVLALLAGLLLVRVFVLQHDCAHRTLLQRKKINDHVGLLLGVLTLVPHHYWRYMHIRHHSTSGNLTRRGQGDIVTLTVAEYIASRSWQRLYYRIYRHPITLLFFGPMMFFLLRFRWPGLISKKHKKERRSIIFTNVGLIVINVCAFFWLEYRYFILIELVVMQTSAAIGITLFYVQHQFEKPYWRHHHTWSFSTAALEGSSHLQLPSFIEWLVGAINLHHIHHLRPNIVNYQLRDYMHAYHLTKHGYFLRCRDITHAFRLKLYDESSGMMVSFRQLPYLKSLPMGEKV